MQFKATGPAVELPIYGLAPPVLERLVFGAIAQLEQGSFYQSAYLWDGMTRDDRLSNALSMRIDRLIGSPMEIEPAIDDEDEEQEDTGVDDGMPTLDAGKAKAISSALERQITQIMPLHQLYRFLSNGIGLSVAIAQKLTQKQLKSSTPTMFVWNNRYLRYDWLLRCYRLVTENKGEISIEPDDPEWMIYEPYGPYGWINGALVRPTAMPWLIRHWVRAWWARHQEVHGQPLRLGIIPSQREPKDESQFLQQLSNLAHEAVIRLPRTGEKNEQGFDVKLLEAASDSWEGFSKLLQHCDDSFSILFLGQRQSTDGQGGLGSSENAGESTMMRITRKDALVCDIVRDQLIKPWAAANYGDEEYAPYVRFRTEPPEDEGKTAKTDLAVAQAVAAFKTAGAPINVRSYLEERGYPLLTEEEESAAKDEQQQNDQAQRDHEIALQRVGMETNGQDQGKDDSGTDTANGNDEG
jgi:hypothetical protein